MKLDHDFEAKVSFPEGKKFSVFEFLKRFFWVVKDRYPEIFVPDGSVRLKEAYRPISLFIFSCQERMNFDACASGFLDEFENLIGVEFPDLLFVVRDFRAEMHLYDMKLDFEGWSEEQVVVDISHEVARMVFVSTIKVSSLDFSIFFERVLRELVGISRVEFEEMFLGNFDIQKVSVTELVNSTYRVFAEATFKHEYSRRQLLCAIRDFCDQNCIPLGEDILRSEVFWPDTSLVHEISSEDADLSKVS